MFNWFTELVGRPPQYGSEFRSFFLSFKNRIKEIFNDENIIWNHIYRICLSYLAYSRLFLFIFRFLMKFEGFSFRSLKWWLLLNIFILFFFFNFCIVDSFFSANIQMSFNWFQLTFNKIRINKRRRKTTTTASESESFDRNIHEKSTFTMSINNGCHLCGHKQIELKPMSPHKN